MSLWLAQYPSGHLPQHPIHPYPKAALRVEIELEDWHMSPANRFSPQTPRSHQNGPQMSSPIFRTPGEHLIHRLRPLASLSPCIPSFLPRLTERQKRLRCRQTRLPRSQTRHFFPASSSAVTAELSAATPDASEARADASPVASDPSTGSSDASARAADTSEATVELSDERAALSEVMTDGS